MKRNFILPVIVYLTIMAVPFSSAGAEDIIADPKVTLKMRKIAVLPFSDHSHQTSFSGALTWGGNKKIVNGISNYFKDQGLAVSPQRDVEKFLVANRIIKLFGDPDRPASFSWSIIHSSYSPLVIKEFMKNILKQSGGPTELSKEMVIKLGKELGVDAVVRGIILENRAQPIFDTRSITERHIDEPFGGIIPFVIGDSVNQGASYSSASKYEDGLPPAKDIRATEGKVLFALGKAPVLRIRIYIQSTKNGAVLWTGGLNIRYALTTALDDDTPSFDSELEKKVRLVMDNFFSNLYRCHGEGLGATIYAVGGAGDKIVIWHDDLGKISSPPVNADRRSFDSRLKKKSKKLLDDFSSKLYDYRGYWFLIKEKR